MTKLQQNWKTLVTFDTMMVVTPKKAASHESDIQINAFKLSIALPVVCQKMLHGLDLVLPTNGEIALQTPRTEFWRFG